MVVVKRHLSVLLKTSYYMPLSVECCGNVLRLQCCLQDSSAVKGIDR